MFPYNKNNKNRLWFCYYKLWPLGGSVLHMSASVTGITKTHDLYYQDSEALQAVFASHLCPNVLKAPARSAPLDSIHFHEHKKVKSHMNPSSVRSDDEGSLQRRQTPHAPPPSHAPVGSLETWWCISRRLRRRSPCPSLLWESAWGTITREQTVSWCPKAPVVSEVLDTDELTFPVTVLPTVSPCLCVSFHEDDVHWDVLTLRWVWLLWVRGGLWHHLLSEGAAGNGCSQRLLLSPHVRLLRVPGSSMFPVSHVDTRRCKQPSFVRTMLICFNPFI